MSNTKSYHDPDYRQPDDTPPIVPSAEPVATVEPTHLQPQPDTSHLAPDADS